jgi:chromosome segregation ATPase
MRGFDAARNTLEHGQRYQAQRNYFKGIIQRFSKDAQAQNEARTAETERNEYRNTQLLTENTRLQAELEALRTNAAQEAEQLETTYLQQVRELDNRRDELEAQLQQRNLDLAAAHADNNNDGVMNHIADPTLPGRIEA